MLQERAWSVKDIAHHMGVPPRDVEDDLRHLFRSLRHGHWHVVIEPAHCRNCGFQFDQDTLHKPSKCPSCRRTWISEPRISLREETDRA